MKECPCPDCDSTGKIKPGEPSCTTCLGAGEYLKPQGYWNYCEDCHD